MPVVGLSYRELSRLAGRPRREVAGALPYLGLDVESESGDEVRVEYSPNRPDYATAYGVALGLRGLLGVSLGSPRLRVRRSGLAIAARPAVAGIRPRITAMAASGRVTAGMVRQLVAMQEDIHGGIGRGRARASVGIHDAGRIRFPLEYTAVPPTHRFAPLGEAREMPVSEVLGGTEAGRRYGRLIAGPLAPALLDAAGGTVSLPPVINAAATAVTPRTRRLLVEVTGPSKAAAEQVLATVCTALHGAGMSLESVAVSGAGNSTPALAPRRVRVPLSLVNGTLGLGLSAAQAASCVRRSRIDAVARGGSILCDVPPHRHDVFGPMDIVEEAALGYGIANLEPELPPSPAPGTPDPGSAALAGISAAMTGLGYSEALNPCLARPGTLYGRMGRGASGAISVADPRSEGSALRDSLLPGLLECLSRNVHEPYPQRLFETGPVFSRRGGIRESESLCAVASHAGASYTEIKSALQAALSSALGARCSTPARAHPGMEEGRSADVVVGGRAVGSVGEVSRAVAAGFRLREPVAAFEVGLGGLLA